ncbi:hypothetical protein T4B_5111, partial [Trichinella pseudospiralis]
MQDVDHIIVIIGLLTFSSSEIEFVFGKIGMEWVEIRMDLVARSQVAYFTRYCRNHIWIRKYSDDEQKRNQICNLQ